MTGDLRRFGEETRPSEAAAARVHARAVETADGRRYRQLVAALRRPRLAAGAGLAVAAVGLIATFVAAPPPATPLHAELSATVDWETHVASDAVRMHFKGRGTLSGTEQAPDLEWESGTVRLAVSPEAGVDLHVRTPEAVVRVLGTRFAVRRDSRGSRVEVGRGLVSVHCADGTDLELTPGKEHTCVPVSAAGLLARAQSLDAELAPLSQVLGALDKGLARVASQDPVAAELSFHRVSAYAGRGLFEEALAAAVALDGPQAGHRRADLSAVILRLAYRVGGCERAKPHRVRLAPGAEDPLEGRCE